MGKDLDVKTHTEIRLSKNDSTRSKQLKRSAERTQDAVITKKPIIPFRQLCCFFEAWIPRVTDCRPWFPARETDAWQVYPGTISNRAGIQHLMPFAIPSLP